MINSTQVDEQTLCRIISHGTHSCRPIHTKQISTSEAERGKRWAGTVLYNGGVGGKNREKRGTRTSVNRVFIKKRKNKLQMYSIPEHFHGSQKISVKLSAVSYKG